MICLSYYSAICLRKCISIQSFGSETLDFQGGKPFCSRTAVRLYHLTTFTNTSVSWAALPANLASLRANFHKGILNDIFFNSFLQSFPGRVFSTQEKMEGFHEEMHNFGEAF